MLEEFPDATIFRPTELYGPADVFIRHYWKWGRMGLGGHLPLWKKGEETAKVVMIKVFACGERSRHANCCCSFCSLP